jgi:uroporphyrinogen-III synthase
MRVLVTRPEPDVHETAAALARLGHEPVLAPLLRTVFASDAQLPTEGISALVATSQNGLRGLAASASFQRLKSRPLFVVGQASARLASELGFADVHPAAGTAADLVELLADRLDPNAGALLYAAGRDRSGDLVGDLAERGLKADLVEVYRAESIDRLPDPVVSDLRAGHIDRVLIFSARSADVFVRALVASDLLTNTRALPIHVISPKAAAPLQSAGFLHITVAERPDQDALLRSLMSASSSGWTKNC